MPAPRKETADEVELIFPWKNLEVPVLPKLIAAGLVAGALAFILVFVKVRLTAVPRWVEEKASVIYLSGGPDGRFWTRRAQEGGPFPIRFDPGSWSELTAAEEQAMKAAVTPQAPYLPTLRKLPRPEPAPPISLIARGERMFPERSARTAIPRPAGSKLVPRLYPLSAVPLEMLPSQPPAFDGEISPEMTSTPWRFVLRLSPEGFVIDSISLVGTAGAESAALDGWLRSVKFTEAAAAGNEWLAVAVTFLNEPDHGADTE